MLGRVTSQQVCQYCKAKGQYRERAGGGLICCCGRFAPTLFEVEIYWRRKRVRITCDQLGRRIDGYRHATRVLEVIRSQIDAKTFDPADWKSGRSNRYLWSNYLDDYLARENRRLVPDRAATFAKKRSLVKHLKGAFQCNIKEVNAALVEDYFTRPCLKLALSAKSRADLAGELRFIFRRAVDREEIAKVPRVPSITVPEKPIQWLDAAQQEAVLGHISEEHRPIFIFLMDTGCRVAEACALCWDQVDQDNGLFYLSRTFSRRRLSPTNKTKRLLPLPITDKLRVLLDQAARTYKDLGRVPAGEAPVFVNSGSHPTKNPKNYYLPDYLNDRWREAMAAAGMEFIELKNATRHSLGTQLLNSGVDLATVARLLTHTSTAHTKKYAVHQVETLKRTRDQAAGKVHPLRRQHRPK